MEQQRCLIKVDKNGTQYFGVTCSCGKCRGTGIVDCYVPVNGGVCFDCEGSGIVHYIEKIMTPEYQEKLREQRAKRQAKKDAQRKAQAAELNKIFFEKQGFNSQGKTFAFIGDTYEIKNELKEMGSRWHGASGLWILDHKVENYKQVELDVSELYVADYTGVYTWQGWKKPDDSTIKKIEAVLNADKKPSEYVGTEGESIELQVVYTRWISFETPAYGGYGMTNTFIYYFEDAEGNQLIWKTSSVAVLNKLEKGDKVTIKATVKEHKEYKGSKQTTLQRVKVIA